MDAEDIGNRETQVLDWGITIRQGKVLVPLSIKLFDCFELKPRVSKTYEDGVELVGKRNTEKHFLRPILTGRGESGDPFGEETLRYIRKSPMVELVKQMSGNSLDNFPRFKSDNTDQLLVGGINLVAYNQKPVLYSVVDQLHLLLGRSDGLAVPYSFFVLPHQDYGDEEISWEADHPGKVSYNESLMLRD